MASNTIESLKSILQDDEIIHPESANYDTETVTYSADKNKRPSLVVRPKTVDSLKAVVVLLANSTLDFAIRGRGYGGGSAKDVVVTMTAFDGFEFDHENEVVTLGAGQNWASFYDKLAEVAPGYVAVTARTPDVGVAGSILHGGFSWLSQEFGCASDPANLLDAEVVKLNGEVVWASQEPDLMWALRGGGPGFGVVTKFKLKAYRYPQKIWQGTILVPNSTLPQVAKGFAKFTASKPDPKLAAFLFKMRKELFKMLDVDEDVLAIHVFDALGEEHGRSEAGFKWVLDLPGAIDRTVVADMRGVVKLQARVDSFKSKYNIIWNPRLLREFAMTEETILKSFEWYDNKVGTAPGTIPDASMLVLEFFAFNAMCERHETAWPRPKGFKHILLTTTGYEPSATEDAELALKLASESAGEIGIRDNSLMMPTAAEKFHDVAAIYSENYPKLQAIKRKYDPRNRLPGHIQA